MAETKTIKPTERKEAPVPRVAAAASFDIFEQGNLTWRHVCKSGTRTEDLEHPDYLGAIATKLSDNDLLHIFSEDRQRYWQALVIQGGRDGSGGGGSGRARLMVLPSYPVDLPAVNRNVNDGLPEGYSVQFDGFRRVHIPMWDRGDGLGMQPLSPDGWPRYEDARAAVIHHSAKATSLPPRISKS